MASDITDLLARLDAVEFLLCGENGRRALEDK